MKALAPTPDLLDEIKNAHPKEFGVLLARAGTEIERLRSGEQLAILIADTLVRIEENFERTGVDSDEIGARRDCLYEELSKLVAQYRERLGVKCHFCDGLAKQVDVADGDNILGLVPGVAHYFKCTECSTSWLPHEEEMKIDARLSAEAASLDLVERIDLAMLVKRLIVKLRTYEIDTDIEVKASHYLKTKDLIGSPLRED